MPELTWRDWIALLILILQALQQFFGSLPTRRMERTLNGGSAPLNGPRSAGSPERR